MAGATIITVSRGIYAKGVGGRMAALTLAIEAAGSMAAGLLGLGAAGRPDWAQYGPMGISLIGAITVIGFHWSCHFPRRAPAILAAAAVNMIPGLLVALAGRSVPGAAAWGVAGSITQGVAEAISGALAGLSRPPRILEPESATMAENLGQEIARRAPRSGWREIVGWAVGMGLLYAGIGACAGTLLGLIVVPIGRAAGWPGG